MVKFGPVVFYLFSHTVKYSVHWVLSTDPAHHFATSFVSEGLPLGLSHFRVSLNLLFLMNATKSLRGPPDEPADQAFKSNKMSGMLLALLLYWSQTHNPIL